MILYFIQFRHTDDFPSTGTRLVLIIRLLQMSVCLRQGIYVSVSHQNVGVYYQKRGLNANTFVS